MTWGNGGVMKRPGSLKVGIFGLILLSALLAPTLALAEVTPLASPTRVEDDNRAVKFSGRWSYSWDQSLSGWSAEVSTKSGSTATLKFSGTGAALIAPLRPNGGLARVAVDGSHVATISLYAAEPATSAAVWSVVGLPAGTHRVVVTVTGSHEASSSGVAVAVDAFEFEGTLLGAGSTGTVYSQSDYRIYRKAPWSKRTSSGAIRGSALYSANPNASINVRFSGTGITWMGRKSPASGLAAVFVDGSRIATVGGGYDQPMERRVLYSITGLTNGTHRLTIKPLGLPSVEGSGTAIDADAFVVYGKTIFCPRPTPFKYPWRTYIVIDKSDYKLYWVKDKTLVKIYPIAHGKNNCTPTRVWRIDAKYYTSPGSVYGPRKMRMFKRVGTPGHYRYVYTAYAIHGTNQEWVIGTQASHGCIRMYNRDVKDLFPRVKLGTMVVTRQ